MSENNNKKPQKRDKLTLKPLEFDEAVKGILEVKPETKKPQEKDTIADNEG